MRIERVELHPLLYKLSKPYGDANGFKQYRSSFLFKIVTDTGVEGWGECADWLPTLVQGFEHRIIPFLIDKKVSTRQRWLPTLRKWHQRAAAGVSMALTEIVAKRARLSVCDLWGGKRREAVPVYASFQSYYADGDWMNESLKQIEASLRDNFTCIKVKVGKKSVQDDHKHIRSVLNTVGERVQVAIDANESYDFAIAREWARWLEAHSNIAWFEEPMSMDRINDYKRLRSIMRPPVAGGENLLPSQFTALLREGALDIIQPDPVHMHDINDFLTVMNMSRWFGARVSPHAYDGSLSRMYAIFAQACLPSWTKMEEDEIAPVEWDVMDNPFRRIVNLQPSKGYIHVPDGEGTGLQIDMELLKYYHWDGHGYA